MSTAPVNITTDVSIWKYKNPFRIAYHTFDASEVLTVEVECEGLQGRGEAASHPHPEVQTLAEGMAQIELLAGRDDLSPESIQILLPAGPARNALDCALWDLRCKQLGKRIWEILDLQSVRPLQTAYTIGIASEQEMISEAIAQPDYSFLKLKVDGDRGFGLLAAIADVRPDARFIIDANEGWQPDQLAEFVDRSQEFPVVLIEQPLPRGADAVLTDFECAIPLAADESFHRACDVVTLSDRYDVINVKLDKIGGLTEALEAVREAQRLGVEVMIGCNGGTSLGIAPAWVIGQFCSWVDLDSPLLLERDRSEPMAYAEGSVQIPAPGLWG
jgi:L-alanine-DL-glutamate epimerase-like enolase superfamily enzyme